MRPISTLLGYFTILAFFQLSLFAQVNGPWVQSPVNGHWYNTVGPNTWTECRSIALSEGAELATIRNQAENNWAFEVMAQNSAMWIGFTDEADEGNFSWISGEPVTFTNWYSGEPNGATNENFALFWGDAEWNDGRGSSSAEAIVEKPGSIDPVNSITPNSFNFSAISGSDTISLSYDSGTSVLMYASSNWIDITASNLGDTSGIINFNVNSNNLAARSGSIYVNGQEIAVTQAGSDAEIVPGASYISELGGEHIISVSGGSNDVWSVSSGESWINITNGTGTGNGQIILNLDPNTGASRTGIITFNGQQFTILQIGAEDAPINYSGRISVNGSAPSGTGLFKFALVSEDGSEVYWNSDSTHEIQVEPVAATFLDLDKGFFETPLFVSPIVFDNQPLFLRIWFNDGTNGWQQLSPDKRLSAVPYSVKNTSESSNETIWSNILIENFSLPLGSVVCQFMPEADGSVLLSIDNSFPDVNSSNLVQLEEDFGLTRDGRIVGIYSLDLGAKVTQISGQFALLETGRIIRHENSSFEWARTSGVTAIHIVSMGWNTCDALLEDGRIIRIKSFDPDPEATPDFSILHSDVNNPAISIGEGNYVTSSDTFAGSPEEGFLIYRTNNLDLLNNGTLEYSGQVLNDVAMVFGDSSRFVAIMKNGDMVLRENSQFYRSSGFYIIDVDLNQYRVLAIPK